MSLGHIGSVVEMGSTQPGDVCLQAIASMLGMTPPLQQQEEVVSKIPPPKDAALSGVRGNALCMVNVVKGRSVGHESKAFLHSTVLQIDS